MASSSAPACSASSARLTNNLRSASSSGWRRKIVDRLMSGRFTSKNGVSVGAPMEGALVLSRECVVCAGAEGGDEPRLDRGQERVLLALVEPVHLVEEQ